jgi:tetratricopeptide (TPR) repeat protein
MRAGHCPRFLAAIFILSVSLGMLPLLSAPTSTAAPFQKVMAREPSEQEVDQMLSIAEAQYDIVKILVKQGRFDQVLPEMRKIYELNLPDKYEKEVAESASLAANLLQDRKQFDLAHQVLDEAFARMRRNENKAAVLKVNAFVYKSEGNLDRAIEVLNRAIELEKQRVRP